MCTEHKESQNLQIIFFRNFSYGKEISKRFGHLVVVDVQESLCISILQTLFHLQLHSVQSHSHDEERSDLLHRHEYQSARPDIF